MELREKLLKIQVELKAPKNQKNTFGNYTYRSCEDILEAVKPILDKYKVTLTIQDDIEVFGTNNPVVYEETYYDKDLKKENTRTIVKCTEKLFIKSTAILQDLESEAVITNQAYAELGEHKGMSSEQCTGTASSYCRKYCLNGLFLIDDTKDPDTDEFARQTSVEDKASEKQIDLIKSLVDDIDSMLNYYKISDIKDLTKKQASEIIKRKQG